MKRLFLVVAVFLAGCDVFGGAPRQLPACAGLNKPPATLPPHCFGLPDPT